VGCGKGATFFSHDEEKEETPDQRKLDGEEASKLYPGKTTQKNSGRGAIQKVRTPLPGFIGYV